MMKDEPKVIVDMAALTEPAPDTKKPKATPLEMALEVELDKPATPTPAVAAPRAEDAELDHRVTGRMAPHEPSRAREPSPPATPRARTIEPAGVGQPSRDVARVIAPAETPPARTFGQLLAGTLSLRPR